MHPFRDDASNRGHAGSLARQPFFLLSCPRTCSGRRLCQAVCDTLSAPTKAQKRSSRLQRGAPSECGALPASAAAQPL